ncbi:MAG: hypothetical protein IJX27_00755 [Clostridia bacterium]|nr:hypothetical protein [Clostridia bacterium]
MMNNIPNAAETKSKATKTTLQKQAIAIAVVAVLLVIGLVFYFFVLPKLEKTQAKIDKVYPGEYLDPSGTTLYMVQPLTRDKIAKIEVKNDEGLYILNEKGKGAGKTFELEDAPGVKLDDYSLAGVIVAAGQPITAPADSKNYRAHESATEKDLIRYGLDENSNPNWFRVTLTDGSSFKIVLGNKLPTSKNCYAYIEGEDRMVDVTLEDGTVEKRYIVYVLDSTSYQTLLFGKTALVGLLVGEDYLGSGVYYTKNFDVYRYENGERNLAISIEESDTVIAGTTQFAMVYPKGYNVDGDVITQHVLPTMSSFEATQVVAIGNDIYKEEVYSKYGLDLNKERLEAGTDTNKTKFYIKTLNSEGDETEITLYVSELYVKEDATTCYYAYVPAQHEIVELSSDTFKWFDWSFGEYVDLRMFFEYINSLDYFSVLEADGSTDARFTLTGNTYNYHVDVTTADGSVALTNKDGKKIVFDVEYETGVVKPTFKGDFENFRALYYVLITRMLDGTEEPVKVADDAECKLTVIAQSIQRDRNQQYYRYDSNGEYYLDEAGTRQSVVYEGGYTIVQNLSYTNSHGTKITHDIAYYDESAKKFFVKAKDGIDGQEKPRDYTYTDDRKLVPVFINANDTTAEYTTVTYEYKFYDMYSSFTNADGSVTEYLNQTYMLVVPTTTTTVWRIEANGEKTLVSTDTPDNGNMGFHIRKVSVEKLVSDTNKALNGIKIDQMAVE